MARLTDNEQLDCPLCRPRHPSPEEGAQLLIVQRGENITIVCQDSEQAALLVHLLSTVTDISLEYR